MYLALIGDLVASRDNPNRADVQRELQALLLGLSKRLGTKVLAAPFALTAGDEVQALFRAPERAVEALQELTDRLALAPLVQPIVFGLGFGALSTALPARAASAPLLDGPCFHQARAALERAQKARGWVACDGFGEPADRVLDALFALQHALRSGWTAKQRLYALEARRLGSQKEVAEAQGVNPSVVSESLKAASFEAILLGEEALRLLLANVAMRAQGA